MRRPSWQGSRPALWLLLLLLATVAPTVAQDAPSYAALIERRAGDDIELVVESLVQADVTVTIDLDVAENVTTDRPLPRTVVVSPGAPIRALRVSPPRDGRRWRYHYQWNARLGNANAVHDPSVVYALPFRSGETCSVLQGFDGTFSHQGDARYAVDWRMAAGTEVCAAREGKVVYTVDRFTRGAADRSLLYSANFITIRHADGTCGDYVHLQRGGVRVRVGQWVRAGDVIGLSGNTGYTTEPHLHFAVFRPRNGIEGESFPIRFRVAGSDAPVTPREGASYTAP